jgi:hypothetical protein
MRRWLSAFMVLFLACMLILPVAAADPGSDVNPGSKDPQADDPAQPPPPPVQTVQVPTGSLVFGTPDGWTLDNSQNQDPILATVFGPNANLRLQVTAYPQVGSLDDEVASFKSYIADNQVTIAGDAAQDLTIGAESAKSYTFSGTRQDGSPVSGNFTVALHEGQIYAFITFANAPSLPNADRLGILLGSVGFIN